MHFDGRHRRLVLGIQRMGCRGFSARSAIVVCATAISGALNVITLLKPWAICMIKRSILGGQTPKDRNSQPNA
jgi:hypothetical protein